MEPGSRHAALTALLARAAQEPPPFYRDSLRAAGLTDPRPPDAGALARLPLTPRAALVRDQLDHLPHGTRRFVEAAPPVRAGTTGSGRDLLVLTWSAADLACERAAGVRVLSAIGVSRGMRVANALPGALVSPGSLLMGDVIEEIGALDVPLGAIETDTAARQAWELVDRVQPDVLILDDVGARRLLAAAPAARRDWWRGIVWLRRGADSPPSAQIPAPAGFTGWQRTWLAAAEATSFVAGSCAASRFHIDEGVFAEIVDAEGVTVPAGQHGMLALTKLFGDTALLRYASGIAARTTMDPCSCGEVGSVVELL